jgi:heme-degrading monooxygenase HmoA
MFARVITAEAGSAGIDAVVDHARSHLPSAQEQAGFAGYYLLTDAETGSVVVISLWETREQMEAVGQGQPRGIRDEGGSAEVLTTMDLETYEVALRA